MGLKKDFNCKTVLLFHHFEKCFAWRHLNPDILFTHCLLRYQLRASRGNSVKPTEPCHPHVRSQDGRSKELPCPRQKDEWTSTIAATGQSLLHVPCPACKSNGHATIRDGSLQKEDYSFQCSSPPSDLRFTAHPTLHSTRYM